LHDYRSGLLSVRVELNRLEVLMNDIPSMFRSSYISYKLSSRFQPSFDSELRLRPLPTRMHKRSRRTVKYDSLTNDIGKSIGTSIAAALRLRKNHVYITGCQGFA